MTGISHSAIRESLKARIQAGEWPLGARIPDEVDFALEYGCARATVNRALRALAEDGLVVRKRKGGTRVNAFPARQAKLEIPIIREQIEQLGERYRHEIVRQRMAAPPKAVRDRLRLSPGDKALYMETVHYGDDRPFAFEARWVNVKAAPDILNAPLEAISANEWLVKTVPFSTGDVAFAAAAADKKVAGALGAEEGAALFVVERTTWLGEDFITTMKLYYREGYTLAVPL